MHVDEDFADPAIFIFARAQIDLVAAHDCLLGVTLAPLRQFFAFARNPFDNLFHHAFGHHRGARGLRLCQHVFGFVVFIVEGEDRCGQGLRKLGTIAVERIGLQAQLPGQHVAFAALRHAGAVGHVDGLRNCTRNEGLHGRQHADVAFDRQRPLADAPTGIGAIEHRQMFFLDMRRAFQRHRPADVEVGGLNLIAREAECPQHVEIRCVHRRRIKPEGFDTEALPKRPFVEYEADVKGGFQRRFDGVDAIIVKAARPQRIMRDATGHGFQCRVTNRIGHDVVDLGLAITEGGQRFRHTAIDDLEIAATGQGLELDQRKIRFHARGIAIHHQADCPGRCDHRGLRIAEAVCLAQFQCLVPGAPCGRCQVDLRNCIVVERDRQRGQMLVTGAIAMGGAAVVAHHAQHRVPVRCKLRERPDLRRHFGRGAIGNAGHDGGNGAGNRAAFAAVIRNAGGHQKPADIGETKAQRAVLIGKLCNLAAGELRHQHRDFQHDGPQTDGVLERFDIKGAIGTAELHQV